MQEALRKCVPVYLEFTLDSSYTVSVTLCPRSKFVSMRILFCIHTPAQVHMFRNIIRKITDDGHIIKILARDYGPTLYLLEKYGFQFDVYIRPTKTLRALGSLQVFPYVFNQYKLARIFHPDIVVGIGADEALFSTIMMKPCILINDSETMPVQHFINRILGKAILTPACFTRNLGPRQIRYQGYKELAYLHPAYYSPDPSVLNDLKMNLGEKYVILRFNVFDAVHDIGKHGFSVSDQFTLVKEMEKYARVFISPERVLPRELEKYVLPITTEKIHHALYYAQLLVTDTQTMTTEAAILGTPAVRSNNFVGPNDAGNFIELEQKYDLIYSFQKPEKSIKKAIELIQIADLKEQWNVKRQKLLADKIDVTKFMVDFIENFAKRI
jgi:uncharacterized protein